MKASSNLRAYCIADGGHLGPNRPARRKNDGSSEQILLQLANRDRTARGLSPLKWSDALAEAAHQHAVWMARQNALSHQFPGEPAMADRASRAGARFSSLAENVALGPSAEGIHQQWMNSPPHRANLLDPQLDSVGIAVSDRNGTLFAVEDFSLAVSDLSIQRTGEASWSKSSSKRKGCIFLIIPMTLAAHAPSTMDTPAVTARRL